MKTIDHLTKIIFELTCGKEYFRFTRTPRNDTKRWHMYPVGMIGYVVESIFTPTQIVNCYKKFGIKSLILNGCQIEIEKSEYLKEISKLEKHKRYQSKCNKIIKKHQYLNSEIADNARQALSKFLEKCKCKNCNEKRKYDNK